MDLIPIANPNAVGLGVGRRMKDDPDFPRVYHINGRNYIDGAELAAYKQRLIQRAVAEPPHPSHGEAADSPMIQREDPAALATRTGPKDLSFDGDYQPHSRSKPPIQALLSPLRREVAEGCFRLSAIKLLHAADNIAIGDDLAAWPAIDSAEFHCAEGTSLLHEEECGA